MTKPFKDLSSQELWLLRNGLNPGYIHEDVKAFLCGYEDYIWNLARREKGDKVSPNIVHKFYDNEVNLCDFFYSQDFSWVKIA